MAKDKEKDKPIVDHAGSTAAEDSELTLWLNRLWARNEPPERVELWQMFGRNRDIRGEMIHHEDFRPDNKDVEKVNRLANEIIAAAQHDCDSVRKEMSYQLAVIDRNRKSNPLTRRVGPLQPKRSYALAKTGFDPNSETDDGEEISIKQLELTHIKLGLEESRFDKTRNDHVLGDVLMLYRDSLMEQRTYTQQLMSQVMNWFGKVQEAEDRRLQRELIMQKEKFKLNLMEDGMRTARNLLPGLFAGTAAAPAAIPSVRTETGASTGGVVQDYGHSQERVLVGNFLHDIDKAGEEVGIKLFGNFEEREGKIVQTQPGIFAFKQYRILIGVRDGRMPPNAVDELLPGGAGELAITQEQIVKALEAGVTEGIGTALLELVGLRKRAQEAALAAAQSTPQPTQPSL